MTHAEEFNTLVGSYEDNDGELCRRCQDWPCRCLRDAENPLTDKQEAHG